MVETGAGAAAGAEDDVTGSEEVVEVGVVGMGVGVTGSDEVVVGIGAVGIVGIGIEAGMTGSDVVVVGGTVGSVAAAITWAEGIVGIGIVYIGMEPSGVIRSSNHSRRRRGDCFIASSP